MQQQQQQRWWSSNLPLQLLRPQVMPQRQLRQQRSQRQRRHQHRRRSLCRPSSVHHPVLTMTMTLTLTRHLCHQHHRVRVLGQPPPALVTSVLCRGELGERVYVLTELVCGTGWFVACGLL